MLKGTVKYMKTILKAFIIIIICITTALSLVSCGDGIDTDEAKAFINDFFDAVSADDFEKAQTFLHPERPADLKTFLDTVESETEIDFQSGIRVEKYTNFSYAYYDSSVGGSAYELTIKAAVGDKTVKFTVEIVQNDEGYGIYNFDIDT